MASVSAIPPGFQIVEFSGPLLIGALLNGWLFGILSVQVYLYYEAFPNDRLATKCLVYVLFTLDVVETILITHDAFATFGYGFGDVSAVTQPRLAWLTIPIMGGLVAFIGQSFYAYRIYGLSKSWFIPVFIGILSLISAVAACTSGTFGQEVRNTASFTTPMTRVASGVWLSASCANDIVIAGCMAYYLSTADSAFRRTRVFLSKLIRLTIETGSVTALTTLTTLALFYAFPNGSYDLVPGFIIPALYANAVLAVLNARFRIVGGRGTYVSSMDMIETPTFIHTAGTNQEATNDGCAYRIAINPQDSSKRDLHGHVDIKGMRAGRSNDCV
ncbi:hypothetical protein DFH09DRAFT_1360703 [Mycena vulgaris]|nr:hypothetical protein DFH09DRAFT_1360703 [Mycena vulgaris]